MAHRGAAWAVGAAVLMLACLASTVAAQVAAPSEWCRRDRRRTSAASAAALQCLTSLSSLMPCRASCGHI